MSSENIARVRIFYRKADELEDKGHLLRAAENYKRTAEAARALDSGPDNLIVADMQRYQGQVLLNYAMSVDNSTAEARSVVASHRAESVSLFAAVAAAVERRRVAGTLLEGKCTAAEEAWEAALLQDADFSAKEVAWRAKLVGYDTFLRAAFSAMCLLNNAWFFTAECSAAQFEAFAQCVMHAADLMQQPRSHDTMAMSGELCGEFQFAQKFASLFVADDAPGVPYLKTRGLDARLVTLLANAWQRLQRSGVLEARGLLDERRRLEVSAARDKTVAAIDAAMAAPGLRSCALAGCGAKEAHPQHFKSCAACRTVVYCCREHQVEGWPSHKKACNAACKAAASADGGGAGPGAASRARA